MNLTREHAIKIQRFLYGIPEAGNYWFKTYHSHHVDKLEINQSTYDPCLLYRTNPFGLVGL
jgi:hypothetical protein